MKERVLAGRSLSDKRMDIEGQLACGNNDEAFLESGMILGISVLVEGLNKAL